MISEGYGVPTGVVPRIDDKFDRIAKSANLVAHSHYFKNVEKYSHIDVYRVLELFDVTNPSIAHAVKKLLVAGGRGAGKDISQDVREAVDSLNRWLDMRREDAK